MKELVKTINLRSLIPLAFLLTMLSGCCVPVKGDFTGGTGTAVLSWMPPTSNIDGSPVNLTGFNIYASTSPFILQRVRTVGALDMITVIEGLAPDTYFFAVSAISYTGAESDCSNIESKTIS